MLLPFTLIPPALLVWGGEIKRLQPKMTGLLEGAELRDFFKVGVLPDFQKEV